jgi:Transport and Golgi organisation 2
MCTVSVVPRRDGLRIVCNRDEQRTRPAALPPRIRRAGRRRATWPVDPAGGGTWIGVNDAGLVACLLNRNPRSSVDCHRAGERSRFSRGTIVPSLLAHVRFDRALEAAMRIAGDAFEPFTLVVLQDGAVAELQNIDLELTLQHGAIRQPIVLTSSSLGDHLVEAPRRALFDELVTRSRAPLAGQAAFHRHRWRDRPEISVRMSRPEAATVSRTVVDVAGGVFSMRYTALPRS